MSKYRYVVAADVSRDHGVEHYMHIQYIYIKCIATSQHIGRVCERELKNNSIKIFALDFRLFSKSLRSFSGLYNNTFVHYCDNLRSYSNYFLLTEKIRYLESYSIRKIWLIDKLMFSHYYWKISLNFATWIYNNFDCYIRNYLLSRFIAWNYPYEILIALILIINVYEAFIIYQRLRIKYGLCYHLGNYSVH